MEIFAVNYQAASASANVAAKERKKERMSGVKERASIVYFIFIVFRSRKNCISPDGPIEFCMNHLVWSEKMNLNVLR